MYRIFNFLSNFCTMSSINRCYIINLNTKKTIELPHLNEIILGRNPATEIQDLKVSKKQIICTANVEEKKVNIKVIGNAISCCNGLALSKNTRYSVGYKDIIEVSLGKHKFEINFDPPPIEEIIDEPKAKKPKLEFPIFKMDKETPRTNFEGNWEEIDSQELLIFTPINCKSQNKIAGFDIDGTIIRTKSGARFPKNFDDWVLNYDIIPKKLQNLLEDNFKLVFFTNQSGVGNDSSKIKDFKRKIENIVRKLNVPVQVFISLGKKWYRKPRIGMWNALKTHKNEQVEINKENSFFVGDAAGREKEWAPKKKKDHAIADRLFAMNIGLKFYTPEEYFLNQKPVAFKMPEFDPRLIDMNNLTYPDINYNNLNVILMVGGPGSGKSHFAKTVLVPNGYIHISRDNLGTWQKCVKLMIENLERNTNVVIDNTNVDKETRRRFIEEAKKLNADVRCFIMDSTLEQIRHNNKFRELTDQNHAIVSDIIIFSYRKNYEEPELTEGFSQILKIPLIIDIKDESLKELYKTFLLE